MNYGILLAAITLMSYFSGLMLNSLNCSSKASQRGKRLFLSVSIILILSSLFFFKYFNFATGTAGYLLSFFSIGFERPVFDIMLPLGISFYTFQALSYIIDIYRKDVKVQKHIGKYALYMSFFPQLLAGPINKSKYLLPQFEEKHSFDYDRIKNGLLLMLWGYFQKLIIADRLAILVNTVYDNPTAFKGFEIITATVFFAIQLYCDFSSYSDIARGAGLVLGFNLVKNFERPYFGRSIQEFWRRWHISLTSWFRDYLYFPLGGSRVSRIKKYRNIMIVFLLSGLWHGAGWTFVLWGALQGFYQIMGMELQPLRDYIIGKFRINRETLSHRLLQSFFVFLLIDFSFIFFRANSFGDAVYIIKNMFVYNPWIYFDKSIYTLGLDEKDFKLAILSIICLIIVDLLRGREELSHKIARQNVVFRWSLYLGAIFAILIFGIYGSGYNAINFIYFQF
jgi:D-alanyl-lipoteichoic acid acyltransferase DltB (MBOAT superfamily)